MTHDEESVVANNVAYLAALRAIIGRMDKEDRDAAYKEASEVLDGLLCDPGTTTEGLSVFGRAIETVEHLFDAEAAGPRADEVRTLRVG